MNPVMEPSPTIHRPETNDVAPSRNDDSSASRINAAADPNNGLPSGELFFQYVFFVKGVEFNVTQFLQYQLLL